jgi:hypothetical protein
MGDHIDWLLAAISRGATRHDAFEVERHFAVSSREAVRLGALLHDIAGSATALEDVDAIVLEYRSAGGTRARVTCTREADGRLGAPRFN